MAGSGGYGKSGDGGQATSALVNLPLSVAVDASGNIYITDYGNSRIRMVTKSTGIISTVAGSEVAGYSGDGGQATSAQLNGPLSVAVDASGNIYIADSGNYRIRMVSAVVLSAAPTMTPTPPPASIGPGKSSCAAGMFLVLSASCASCPAGTSAKIGSSTCTPCAAGSYAGPSSSDCTLCSPGYYAAAGSSCSVCQSGTYSAVSGSTACTACPTGHISGPGAISCTL